MDLDSELLEMGIWRDLLRLYGTEIRRDHLSIKQLISHVQGPYADQVAEVYPFRVQSNPNSIAARTSGKTRHPWSVSKSYMYPHHVQPSTKHLAPPRDVLMKPEFLVNHQDVE